jgi:hypothetical protein
MYKIYHIYIVNSLQCIDNTSNVVATVAVSFQVLDINLLKLSGFSSYHQV